MNGSVSYEGALLSGNININTGAQLEELTADHNGIYLPSQGKDGFSKVTVDVPDPVLDDITITANGHYTPPSGVDGYDDIVVSVPHPAPVLDSITITMNGNYTPPSGIDGYDNIQVEVPIPTPVLDDITITVNGTYTPPSGVDGYDEIVVNVPLPANGIYKQTLSGLPSTIATFTGAYAPIDSLKASIDSTGWSSCEVTKKGKNLISFMQSRENVGITFTYNVTTGGTTMTGTAGGNSYQQGSLDSSYSIYPIYPAGSYIVNVNELATGISMELFYYSLNGVRLGDVRDITVDGVSFTLEEPCYVMPRFVVTRNTVLDTPITLYPMIRVVGVGDGTFEPYTANTYTIPFTDGTNQVTVYNGIIDITGGSWSGKDSIDNDITGTFIPVLIRSDGVSNISINCGDVTECKYYSITP